MSLVIWSRDITWYYQQLRPKLGSHQSNIGILQKSCEGQWVAQIIAIGLNFENNFRWHFKEGGAVIFCELESIHSDVYSLSRGQLLEFIFPRHRFKGIKTSSQIDRNIEYWTFMTKCNTFPARIANRGWQHNWPKNMSLRAKSKTHEFYMQTCTESLNGPAVKGQWKKLIEL